MGELACKQKIILDGTNVSGLAQALCETTRYLDPEAVSRLTDENAYPIIQRLNQCENLILEAQWILTTQVMEYDGPLPKMLEDVKLTKGTKGYEPKIER